MVITTERLEQFMQDIYDQYQREEDQAILQRDMDKATRALSGKEACIRIKNNLGMRIDMDENLVLLERGKKRA